MAILNSKVAFRIVAPFSLKRTKFGFERCLETLEVDLVTDRLPEQFEQCFTFTVGSGWKVHADFRTRSVLLV